MSGVRIGGHLVSGLRASGFPMSDFPDWRPLSEPPADIGGLLDA